MSEYYTVTIKFAPIGTALAGGGTSSTGHMWYELHSSNPSEPDESHGWSTGTTKGEGGDNNLVNNDNVNYIPDEAHRITSMTTDN